MSAPKREVLQLPHIPKGLATVLGQWMIAGLAVAAAVFAFAKGGDHRPEALVSLGGAVLTGVTIMGGRYAQTCALLRPMRSPLEPADAPAAAAVGPIVVHCCHCHGSHETAGDGRAVTR